MIELVDQRLREWVGTVLNGIAVSFLPPSELTAGESIGLYLFQIMPVAPPRSANPPLQLALSYLVSASAENPEVAHRLIGRLTFAALENAEFEVEASPPPNSLWRVLGVIPRPAFILKMHVRQERPERVAPFVLAPLSLQNSTLGSLHGMIIAAGDIPIAGGNVEIPALQRHTYSDSQGRFHFAGIPNGSRSLLVRVRAHGQTLAMEAATAMAKGEPLIIHLPTPEN